QSVRKSGKSVVNLDNILAYHDRRTPVNATEQQHVPICRNLVDETGKPSRELGIEYDVIFEDQNTGHAIFARLPDDFEMAQQPAISSRVIIPVVRAADCDSVYRRESAHLRNTQGGHLELEPPPTVGPPVQIYTDDLREYVGDGQS